ncbi:hypothetical protein [Nostoc sp.]
MNDVRELKGISDDLRSVVDHRLRKIFPSTHPQFDRVFEDLGAAGYYKRAGWLLSRRDRSPPLASLISPYLTKIM